MAQLRIIILTHPHGQQLGAQLQAIIQREHAYRVDVLARTLLDGIAGLEPRPDLILLLLPAAKERAEHLLATLQAQATGTPLLLILQAGDLPERLDERFPWAMDFLLTPLREAEVHARVRRLLAGSRAPERHRVHKCTTATVGLAQLVGEDPAFVTLKRKLPLLAQCEAPVLLTGETGTGKGLCARALHYLSRRAGQPFLPVNCGAIPGELFERELFGHQKGAFTGAWAAQPGLIAEAEGGTLFLDEIETLSLGAQAKLLGFLEEHTYHALGAPRPRQADVWIIAATNVELTRKVQDGTFREDLFYRLAVLTLTLPPLRERRNDIPRLVAHVWARYADHGGAATKQLSPEALEALCHYAWPGNMRELENVIRQVVVLTDAQSVAPEALPIPLPCPAQGSAGDSLQQAKAKVIAQFEQAYITALLQVHQGNVTQAAREARTERRAFGRLIKKYQLAKH
jgi:two-component system response regulator GlrR